MDKWIIQCNRLIPECESLRESHNVNRDFFLFLVVTFFISDGIANYEQVILYKGVGMVYVGVLGGTLKERECLMGDRRHHF